MTAAGAPASERVEGLVYLGAADLFRGRRDSAVAVFKRLVQLDPRYAPDHLVFPPEVTGVFDSVRALTKTVAIVVPPDTQVAPGAGNFSALVLASSFQTVDVTLRYEDGAPFRSLYAGPIGDSLHVLWDGLDAAGQLPPDNVLMTLGGTALVYRDLHQAADAGATYRRDPAGDRSVAGSHRRIAPRKSDRLSGPAVARRCERCSAVSRCLAR